MEVYFVETKVRQSPTSVEIQSTLESWLESEGFEKEANGF